MKQIKYAISVIIVSYLTNCYFYWSLDPSKFPIEVKYWTAFLLVCVIAAFEVINGATAEENKSLKLKIQSMENNCIHDWQPDTYSPKDREQCVKCKGQRGRK